jgi:hypothetical protein
LKGLEFLGLKEAILRPLDALQAFLDPWARSGRQLALGR